MRTNLDPFMTIGKKIVLPVLPEQPTAPYELSLIEQISKSSATNKTGVLPLEGWYLASWRANTGGAGEGQGGATGGSSFAIFYAYEGASYLMWSSKASGRNNNIGATGYPGAETSNLGGRGGSSSDESGGGGGGPAIRSAGGHSDAGGGGSGVGIIIGMNARKVYNNTGRALESWAVGSFGVNTVLAMFLAGGGGGGSGNNGSWRCGGPSGGAWGNGGKGIIHGGLTENNTFGPGGYTFGAGLDAAGKYGGPLNGAWCQRNFTTNEFTFGTGVNTAPSGANQVAGSVNLYWINNQ